MEGEAQDGEEEVKRTEEAAEDAKAKSDSHFLLFIIDQSIDQSIDQ